MQYIWKLVQVDPKLVVGIIKDYHPQKSVSLESSLNACSSLKCSKKPQEYLLISEDCQLSSSSEYPEFPRSAYTHSCIMIDWQQNQKRMEGWKSPGWQFVVLVNPREQRFPFLVAVQRFCQALKMQCLPWHVKKSDRSSFFFPLRGLSMASNSMARKILNNTLLQNSCFTLQQALLSVPYITASLAQQWHRITELGREQLKHNQETVVNTQN